MWIGGTYGDYSHSVHCMRFLTHFVLWLVWFLKNHLDQQITQFWHVITYSLKVIAYHSLSANCSRLFGCFSILNSFRSFSVLFYSFFYLFWKHTYVTLFFIVCHLFSYPFSDMCFIRYYVLCYLFDVQNADTVVIWRRILQKACHGWLRHDLLVSSLWKVAWLW